MPEAIGKEYGEAYPLYFRKLTPIECERLQTFSDNFTAHVSNTQRYKALGNSWTVDVIAHIFKEGHHEIERARKVKHKINGEA